MNWRVILALTPLGLLFAVLTITGWIHGLERQFWLGVVALAAVVVSIRVSSRTVLHGLVAGFLLALVAIELQALFLPTYFSNNPGYADIEIPFGLSARFATVVLGPINAVLAGVVCAILTWLFSKLAGRWRPAPSSDRG